MIDETSFFYRFGPSASLRKFAKTFLNFVFHPFSFSKSRAAPGAFPRSRLSAISSKNLEKIKVTVWGINYAPEPTGIAPFNAALCAYLHEQRHEVQMVCGFPYYPLWKKQAQDRRQLYRTDLIDGVKVHRCWQYVPARTSVLKRVLHEASFVAASFCKMLFLARPDVYVVISPPLFLGAAAWIISRIKRAPYIFHVQDLQPDAAVGLGMLKPSPLTRALYGLENLAYEKATRVSSISAGILKAFAAKNVPSSKHVFFPNGVALPDDEPLPPAGNFRQRSGFAPDDFLAIYSGNLGVKQGLDVLAKAAPLLRDARVRIIICGHGAQRDHLMELIAEAKTPQICLLPLQDDAAYREMLRDADVCLITQQKGSGQAFLPSKLLNALALAKAVLTVADEESALSAAVQEGQFGVNVLPGDPAQLAQVLDQLCLEPERLKALGRAGREFVKQFELHHVLGNFVEVLQEVKMENLGRRKPVTVPETATFS